MAGCATPTSSAGHPGRGAPACHALTFDPDHFRGAGQERLRNLVQEHELQLGMVFLDGISVRAHQKAAGVTRRGISS